MRPVAVQHFQRTTSVSSSSRSVHTGFSVSGHHILPPSPKRSRIMSSDAADSDPEISSRSQQSPLASRRAPTSQEQRGRIDTFFPLGYKQGFNQWWGAPTPAQAEHTVLSFIPYLRAPPTHTQTGSEPPSTSPSAVGLDTSPEKQAAPIRTSSLTDPYGPRTWYSRMVELSGKNRALNEFSVERNEETTDNNLVILHGYGAGLGFFYKNFEPLSRAKGWHLYALDLLGMGRSSRPPFKIHAKQRADQISEAEDWFIDSLEEWRIKRKIEKMTLMGHSMGGYMAVCYALKYPGRLEKLILASPVGIPEDPYAVKADMPEPGESTLANEFTQDQALESTRGDNNNFLNARSNAAKMEQKQAANPNRLPTDKDAPPRKPLPKWLTYLWDSNISPFSFVRWSGPLGPKLVSGWTSRRFSHLPPEEASALHAYSYSLFSLRGSGEYALAYILAPGAFARSPLIRRIGGVGRQPLASTSATAVTTEDVAAVREQGIPVVLLYGENDWMDVKGGYAAKQVLDAEREKALKDKSDAERRNDQGGAKVVIIKKAGHHVYLDNAEHFNQVVQEEMRDVEKRQQGLKKGSAGGVEIRG